MNKVGSAGFWIITFFLLVVGFFIWAYSQDYDFSWGDKDDDDDDFLNDTIGGGCIESDFPELDKVAYYFDNDVLVGFNNFLQNSEQRLYCSFTFLNNENIAKRLIALENSGVKVKVHFGIDKSMKSCELTCVPNLESQYNLLLSEGIPVSYSKTNYNFCINEKAVFIFSSIPLTNSSSGENALIIFSPELRGKYDDYFTKISK